MMMHQRHEQATNKTNQKIHPPMLMFPNRYSRVSLSYYSKAKHKSSPIRDTFVKLGTFFRQIELILPLKSKDFSIGALISGPSVISIEIHQASTLHGIFARQKNQNERFVKVIKGAKVSRLFSTKANSLLCRALLCAYLVTKLVQFSLIKKSKQKINRLPPGPKQWPIVGNLFQLGQLPHRDMASFCEMYGPLVYLRLGNAGENHQ
ncbi:hypothetical protein RND71_015535 [Anisodus tanguticus]|uniref:Cytochrome P450 n=1 Tax=Anisodus tanguticus TaxID=243964 RepID=A0AAE1VCY7_9SOLA|nr:hypothetical protein RND71_015535 [Anisodus tanguticus]